MSYAHGWADELRQACHDIRQPTAGVLALAEAALSEADLPENAREFLNEITGLAERQSDVIEHWLWARDDWLPKTQETDVLDVITEAVAARLERGRGGLGGARVSRLLPIAPSRKGGRITNAARAL